MSIENWEHFFKPEVRTSGRRYYSEGNVIISQPSDTEIQAYIRGSSPIKVNLKSPSMASPLITADCTCPASKKGQLCKHIWATLLTVEDKKPEFFDDKEELQKSEGVSIPNATSSISERTKTAFRPQEKRPMSEEQQEKQQAFKDKQADYRKAQYQKQKQRLKDKKQSLKGSKFKAAELPEDVEAAISYFSENGFLMEAPFKIENVQAAKKKLSRIFHPDIGGSHQEIVELNKHSENLITYIESH